MAELTAHPQQELAKAARIEQLGDQEEVSGFALAVVTKGKAILAATIADASAMDLTEGSLVYAGAVLEEAIAMRIVAQGPETRVAVWDAAQVTEAMRDCPWVKDDLGDLATSLVARVGATVGALADIDPQTRLAVLDRLTAGVLGPGAPVIAEGDPVGIIVVGAGSVEVGEGVAAELLQAGEFAFAPCALDGSPAPSGAKAGGAGALVLRGDRKAAQELVAMYPTLIELLASQ